MVFARRPGRPGGTRTGLKITGTRSVVVSNAEGSTLRDNESVEACWVDIRRGLGHTRDDAEEQSQDVRLSGGVATGISKRPNRCGGIVTGI